MTTTIRFVIGFCEVRLRFRQLSLCVQLGDLNILLADLVAQKAFVATNDVQLAYGWLSSCLGLCGYVRTSARGLNAYSPRSGPN